MKSEIIDHLLESLPSQKVGLNDFPYFDKYYKYIIGKVADMANIEINSLNHPILEIKDTPFFESYIISHKKERRIVFDISTSLLLMPVSQSLISGEITKKTWNYFIKVMVHDLLAKGYPGAGIALGLNQARTLLDDESEILFDLKNTKKIVDINSNNEFNIHCQEMFILAHEIVHFFISEGYIDIDIHKEIIDDLSKSPDVSTSLFTFGITENEKTSSYSSFISKETREEMACDIVALEITRDFFTWDNSEKNLLDNETINTSVYLTMKSLLLISSLKNRSTRIINGYFKESYQYIPLEQLLIRDKVIDGYCSISSSASNTHNSSKLENVFSSMLYFSEAKDIVNKRLACIDEIFSYDLLQVMAELHSNSFFVATYFSDKKNLALFLLGFDNKVTRSEKFLASDGSLLSRFSKRRIARVMEDIETDLYYINEKSINESLSFMSKSVSGWKKSKESIEN